MSEEEREQLLLKKLFQELEAFYNQVPQEELRELLIQELEVFKEEDKEGEKKECDH